MKAGKIVIWVLILIGASIIGWAILKFTLGLIVAVIALGGGIIGYAAGNIAGRIKMRRKLGAQIDEMESTIRTYQNEYP